MKLLFGLNQNLEKIPPTQDALMQHTKRSIYQTGKNLIVMDMVCAQARYWAGAV